MASPVTNRCSHAGSGGAQEMEEVWGILMSLKKDVTSGGMKKFEPATESHYDRMGGEAVLRPMCNELYEFHAGDPITAPWFPPSSTWNQRTADQVKENVFTFFSSGIGGPHKCAPLPCLPAGALLLCLGRFSLSTLSQVQRAGHGHGACQDA